MVARQQTTPSPVSVFYSYAPEDEALCQELEKHLSSLRRQGLITEWHARMISPGMDSIEAIDIHLATASVILLLISPDYLASDYFEREMTRALQRHKSGDAIVIPVHLRPVYWEGESFANLPCLPRGAIPVTLWPNRDEAFREVAKDFHRAIIRDVYALSGKTQHPSISLDTVIVTHWSNLDEAFRNVAKIIRNTVTINLQAFSELIQRTSLQYRNILLPLQPEAMVEHPIPAPSRANRRQMLAKVHTFWISKVLEQSLHGAALIATGLQEQSNAVAELNKLVLQRPEQLARPLPSGTRITQVYDDAGGELLILGEPGSGKTTLLLQLTRDLLNRAQKDDAHPMPVVFNLSSWASKRNSLTDWLVEELNTKYQVPRRLGQAWVENDQVLPLLDGLDEVPSEYRAECVDAINTYHRKHNMVPTVVCSRNADYLTQKTRIQLRSAVVVQPLTPQQIDDYLTRAGGQMAALREVFRNDPVLQELAKTPLMLSILTMVYQRTAIEDNLQANTPERRRGLLVATYVQRMLQRGGARSRYTPQQTIYWLAWLARQLRQHSQTEFYIERIQPDWLPNSRSRRIYRGIVRMGIVLGNIQDTQIKPAEVVYWSWGKMKRGLVKSLVAGLVFGLIAWLIAGWSVGLSIGLSAGFVGMLISGLSSEMLSRHNLVTPNQGIKGSARNSLITGLLSWLVVGLVNGLVIGLAGGLVVGLAGGLVVGLVVGGYACIEHFVLRWFLWRLGLIPWDYPHFLDFAADRLLLRKVGGGYIFVHRLLQDYFATLDTTLANGKDVEQTQSTLPTP